jgi:hypothetical protein
VVSTSEVGETAKKRQRILPSCLSSRRSSNAGLGGRQIDLLFVLPFQLPMVLREQSGRP